MTSGHILRQAAVPNVRLGEVEQDEQGVQAQRGDVEAVQPGRVTCDPPLSQVDQAPDHLSI